MPVVGKRTMEIYAEKLKGKTRQIAIERGHIPPATPPSTPSVPPKKVIIGEQLKELTPTEFQKWYPKREEFVVIPTETALSKTGQTVEQWAERAGYTPESVVATKVEIKRLEAERRATRQAEKDAQKREIEITRTIPIGPTFDVPRFSPFVGTVPVETKIFKDVPYTRIAAGFPTEESLLLATGELPRRADLPPGTPYGELPAVGYAQQRAFEAEQKSWISGRASFPEWVEKSTAFLTPSRWRVPATFEQIAKGKGFKAEIGIGTAIVGFGAGIVRFPAAVAQLPETAVAIFTRPGEVLESVVKGITERPVYTISEMVGGAAAAWGVGGLIRTGISKFRARDITTATDVGQYTYDPATGFGKVGVDIVVKKAGKVIETAQAQLGFKTGKLFDPVPFAAKVITKKGDLSYILGKGWVWTKITTPSRIAEITTGKAAGVMFKYPGFKPIAATAGLARTYATSDMLRTMGLSATKRGVTLTGQKGLSYLFRQDIRKGFKITKITTKGKPKWRPFGIPEEVIPVSSGAGARAEIFMKGFEPSKIITKISKVKTTTIKPIISAAVGAQLKTVASLVGKGALPETVIETGLAGGLAIDISIPKVGVKTKDIMAPALGLQQARLSLQKFDTKQASRTLQQLGVEQKQKKDIVSQLGIKQALKTAQKSAITFGVGFVSAQKEKVKLRQVQKVALKSATKMRTAFGLPAFGITAPVTTPKLIIPLLPQFDKRRVLKRRKKPKIFRYREIKHPFPSIGQLLGFKNGKSKSITNSLMFPKRRKRK